MRWACALSLPTISGGDALERPVLRSGFVTRQPLGQRRHPLVCAIRAVLPKPSTLSALPATAAPPVRCSRSSSGCARR